MDELRYQVRQLEGENERLRDLLYEDWKASVEANDEESGTAPTPTVRWYFDELLERRLAPEKCYICGRQRDEPGEMYCSAAHPRAS